ncbi:ATP-binding cassette domain-containing protein [Maritimibacter dapengensis]|uniref:ATP-binding cassette domain-containing protein n=1 Tax=Maritimibacter dapengensis TaxID=2836868 RepID=UPI00300D5731
MAQGKCVFVLGECGSEKSTLLSLICGIVTADRAQVEVAGTNRTTLRPGARDRFRADQNGELF